MENAERIIFTEEIEKAAGGEFIEAITIGPLVGFVADSKDGNKARRNDKLLEKKVPAEKMGVLLKWEEAREYLNYEVLDRPVGYRRCHEILGWTQKWVIYLLQDAESHLYLIRLPRNPIPLEVE